MKIKEFQECIVKTVNDGGLKPDDEVLIYDAFHDDYNETEFVYADGDKLVIQF